MNPLERARLTFSCSNRVLSRAVSYDEESAKRCGWQGIVNAKASPRDKFDSSTRQWTTNKLYPGFAESVREYCDWIEGSPGDSESEVFDAFRLLSRLQADAVILPDIDDEDLPEADDIPDVSHAQKEAAIQRFETFPFRYYWSLAGP